jgi:hypothetical protein
LAWLAIGMAVLAAIWVVLDRRGYGVLEAQRAQWVVNGWPVEASELLHSTDANLAATPAYSEAMSRLAAWPSSDAAIDDRKLAYHEVSRLWSQLEANPTERTPPLVSTDEPVFEQALADLESALLAPECRVYYVVEGQSPAPVGVSFLIPVYIEHAARREFLRGNRTGALHHAVALFAFAGRLREMPTFEFCAESDQCLLRALPLLRTLGESGALDAECAERIRPWLARVHPDADWIRALDGERVLVGGTIWARMREGLEPYRVSIPEDRSGLLFTKLARPWRLAEEAAYFDLLDRKRALIVEHPWENAAAPRIPAHLTMNRSLAQTLFTREPDGTPTSLAGETRLRLRRARDLADIALQLVQRRAEPGSCPASLVSLGELPRDPVLDQPYSLARTATGFTLGLPEAAHDTDGANTWRVNGSPAR